MIACASQRIARQRSGRSGRSFAWSVGLTVAAFAPAVASAQDNAPTEPQVMRVEFVEVVTPSVFLGDLRDLPLVPEWQPGDPIKEIPRRHNPRGQVLLEGPPVNPTTWTTDPLVELQANVVPARASRAFSTPTLNIAGQGFTGVVPPDTVGDVGPNHYIQMVNSGGGSSFRIHNKDGTVAAGPITLDTLGSGVCASGLGDPVVLYDRLADRWLLSEFSAISYRLCVYVSQTNDPVAGGWFNYAFSTPSFPDYPKYAVWPDAYYVSSNESSPAAYALERSQMLIGAAASSQRFTGPPIGGFGFQAYIPSDLDGPTAPPAGSPNYFMRHRDDEAHNPGSNDPTKDFLEVWEFAVDFATPANSTFTGPLNISVTEFDSNLCGLFSFSCVPQPSGSNPLDPLREVVMWRLQYRNFGSHETLVGNLVTDVNGADHHGIRWFELRKVGAGAWTLFQEGTYAPDAEHRWMGSAAMDQDGNIALGYSVSSSTVNPGIRYAGRLATDPAGTLPQGEFVLRNGSGSSFTNRWGDYSSMNVDPADDCTFWYTNERALSNGSWATRIGTFAFDSCLQPPGTPWFIDGQGVFSRKTHGANDFDLPLDLAVSTIEPRSGGPTEVIVGFTEDMDLATITANVTVTISPNGSGETISSVDQVGLAASQVRLNIANLVNTTQYTIAFDTISVRTLAGAAADAGADPDFQVCYLAGDNDQDGTVFVADKNNVVGNWNVGVATLAEALIDFDLDTVIFVSDKNAVTGNWGSSCP